MLNAEWALDEAGVPPNVAEFVRTELGLPSADNPLARIQHQGVNILDHIDEMCQTMLWAGFAAAEQTYTVAPPNPAQEGLGLPDEVRHLRKLAPRPPRTINRIAVERDGGLKAIVQAPVHSTDNDITIPVKQLVFYSHKKIGASWEGQSVLRHVYRPWAMKDMYLRLDLQAVDKHSAGYWKAKTTSKERRDALLESLSNLRNGEENVLVHDPQDEVELVGLSSNLVDIVSRLKYLDQEMSRSALAMFLDLGQENGARNLGEVHLRIFFNKVKALAAYIGRIITEHIIRDDNPPLFVEADHVDAFELTVTHPGAELEDYIRTRHGLPALPAAGETPAATRPRPVPAETTTPQPVAASETALERATILYDRLKERVSQP